MKILIAQIPGRKFEKVINLVQENLQNSHRNWSVEVWDNTKSGITNADVMKAQTDLFVNFNLEGFEQSTLTDRIAYNLLNCKQIHILFDRKLPNEKYLRKQLSISMFFYCVGTEYYQYLMNQYPDIPYLKQISGWDDRDSEAGILEKANALCSIIQEVSEICHLNK